MMTLLLLLLSVLLRPSLLAIIDLIDLFVGLDEINGELFEGHRIGGLLRYRE
ncbi:unnamed protein product [Hymenolepis diminuta]|uniref:Uncharacterized protein n=1 Tax=Hymenolepis diminuta TaxID=6216 RepID=A0A3P7B9I1_HYMDI|nr:unnamed protein product [Hymenolepis diminuta]